MPAIGYDKVDDDTGVTPAAKFKIAASQSPRFLGFKSVPVISSYPAPATTHRYDTKLCVTNLWNTSHQTDSRSSSDVRFSFRIVPTIKRSSIDICLFVATKTDDGSAFYRLKQLSMDITPTSEVTKFL